MNLVRPPLLSFSRLVKDMKAAANTSQLRSTLFLSRNSPIEILVLLQHVQNKVCIPDGWIGTFTLFQNGLVFSSLEYTSNTIYK